MRSDSRKKEAQLQSRAAGRKQPEEVENKETYLTPIDFIKVEKNLTSLGFFTPSSKKIKNAKAKRVAFTRVIEGKRIEVSATIVPAAIYGLPITADQDKYLALQKIITDVQQRDGKVTNPIGFTSAEMLKLLGQGDAGKNYKEIHEWLDLMSSTTIISQGVVYFAGKKQWARDRFRVFERAVSFGEELEQGKVADKNYVWLSEWQLENINHNYLLPIDYEEYKKLKNHIAKALVPLLQIWLYATREEGCFEKRYDEICQILNISRYRYLSKIKEKFAPALDELKAHTYIIDWHIEETSDGKGYKILFYHGEKFHRDRRRRLSQKEKTSGPTRPDHITETTASGRDPEVNTMLLSELISRGISEGQARKLIISLAERQQLMDQLEWGDHLIAQAAQGKFYNPAGFYVHLIKENVSPPPKFESSRLKRLREEARQAMATEEQERAKLELAYEDYQEQEIERRIAQKYTKSEYQQCVAAKKQDLLKQYKNMSVWNEDAVNKLAETSVRQEIAGHLTLISFEEFCAGKHKEV